MMIVGFCCYLFLLLLFFNVCGIVLMLPVCFIILVIYVFFPFSFMIPNRGVLIVLISFKNQL